MDWYPWRFDEDELVKLLTWQERGAYMMVLTSMWKWSEQHGTVDLPDNDWRIAGAVNIPYEDWIVLRERLVDHPAAPLQRDPEAHIIYSPTLRDEYAKSLARTASSRERGRLGGLAKTYSQGSAKHEVSNGLAEPKPDPSGSEAGGKPDPPIIDHRSEISDRNPGNPPGDPSHSSGSPGGSQENVQSSPEYEVAFLTFWEQYPRKEGKRAAWNEWRARRKEGVAADDLLAAAQHYAAYCRQQQTEVRFMKLGKTFLGKHQRAYEEYVNPPPVELTDAGSRPPPRSNSVHEQNQRLLRRRWQQLEEQEAPS